MTLHDHRGRFERTLSPLVDWCADHDVEPNQLTMVSVTATFAAGACFWFSSPTRWWLLATGSFLLMTGAILDSVDGLLARSTGKASALGDFLDHSMDRFGDVALLVGLTFSPWVPMTVGLFAVVGTLLTSYMGTQAQAVGVGRDYGGLVGRADRLTLLFWTTAIQVGLVLAGVGFPTLDVAVAGPVWAALGANIIGVGVGWIAFAGNITALQRFWGALRALSENDENHK